MNHGRPCRRYGIGHEAAIATNAVATIKEAGKVAVNYEAARWNGPGFCAHWVRDDGSRGLDLCIVAATEEEAWLLVAITLAAYKPGVLQMTSREFGSVWTVNVLCPDGSLGSVQRCSRLEIRKLGGQYDVFAVERRYMRGEDPRDVRQQPVGGPFLTVAEAAGFSDKYIRDYEGAEADDREAAIEAQRERESEEREGF